MSVKKSYVSAKGKYKVTFSLPVAAAQGKKSVLLLGDFNNWDTAKGIALKAGKTEFSTSLDLNPGTYEFKYLIDQSIWENDFDADTYAPSPFAGVNNSVLVLPNVTAKTLGKKAVASKTPAAKVVAPKVIAKTEKAPVAKTEKKVTKTVKTENAPVQKAVTVKSDKPAAKTEKKVATPKAAPAPKAVKNADKPVAKKAVKPAKK